MSSSTCLKVVMLVALLQGLSACAQKNSSDATDHAAGTITAVTRSLVTPQEPATPLTAVDDRSGAAQTTERAPATSVQDAADAARAVRGPDSGGAQSAVHNKW